LGAKIETYLPELRESAHQGATVRQMLDMLSAVDYTYTPSGGEKASDS
jgi:hypothetical protein